MKAENDSFGGVETKVPPGNQNLRHVIGKLSKFYTTYMDFDLNPGWGIFLF